MLKQYFLRQAALAFKAAQSPVFCEDARNTYARIYVEFLLKASNCL